jgi:hypothetical protein
MLPDAGAEQPKTIDISKVPVAALRAFSIAYDRTVSHVEVAGGAIMAWTRVPGTYSDPSRERVPYPYPTDFEAAVDLGLLVRHDPLSDHHAPSASGSRFYRWDILSKSLDDVDGLFAGLETVARLDCEEAKDIPGAIPVALVGRMRGATGLEGDHVASSIVGDVDAHVAHGYMVGETRKSLMLRGVVLSDGEAATEASLARHGLGHAATQSAGVTTLRNWSRLSVGMTRETFLEIARIERGHVTRLFEIAREYREEQEAAAKRLLDRSRLARSEFSSSVEVILSPAGLGPVEEQDSPAKALRLAGRLLDSLERPAVEVATRAIAMDSDGTPKRMIVQFLRESGVLCTYADFRKKLEALRDALSLVSPGWDAGTSPDPASHPVPDVPSP